MARLLLHVSVQVLFTATGNPLMFNNRPSPAHRLPDRVHTPRRVRRPGLALALALGFCSLTAAAEPTSRTGYIVQAEDLGSARFAVIKVGGAIANNLTALHAVNAFLTAEQFQYLVEEPGVQIFKDHAELQANEAQSADLTALNASSAAGR